MTRDEIVEASTKVADCWGSLTYRVGANIYTVCDLIAALAAQPPEARDGEASTFPQGPLPGQMLGEVEIDYTNYRGERAQRRITPWRIVYGVDEWHHEAQWLLVAFDYEKQAERHFAMRGIHSFGAAATPVASGAITDAMVEAALHATVPGGAEVWAWLLQEKRKSAPHQTDYNVMRAALSAALAPAPAQQSERDITINYDSIKGLALTNIKKARELDVSDEALAQWIAEDLGFSSMPAHTGNVMVPQTPTPEMLCAGCDKVGTVTLALETWKAMLGAFPSLRGGN